MSDFENPFEEEYKPEIGNATAPTSYSPTATFDGYHDINYLRALLRELKETSRAGMSEADSELTRYTLSIRDDENLQQAQSAVWPNALGTPKDYVSYDQYKALNTSHNRGASYIRRTYENNLRGPHGTNAGDVYQVSSLLYNEADRVENFLDKYLGAVNDSAEYRTIELFQDWAQNALEYARRFRGILKQEKAQEFKTIPDEEINALTEADASKYQALFKLKVNAINTELQKSYDELGQNFGVFSDVFYDKFLGPSLKFQLQVTKELGTSTIAHGDGILAQEARNASQMFQSNYKAALSDQMRRNGMFMRQVKKIEAAVATRAGYNGHIVQLESKGKNAPNKFINTPVNPDERTYFNQTTQTPPPNNSFRSSHQDLLDRLDSDAHPQYLVKSGDAIKGEITFDLPDSYVTSKRGPDGELLPFDGMRPGGEHGHMHRGIDVDGTRQLDATESLLPGTLREALVDAEIIPKPAKMRVLNENVCIENGQPNIRLQIGWDAEDEGHQFEIQVVQYCDSSVGSACKLGIRGDYPQTACQPWVDERVYLHAGHDAGWYGDREPLLPETEEASYEVTRSFSLTLDDQYFIAGLDSNAYKECLVALCKRDSEDSIEWEIQSTLVVGTNVVVEQGYMSGVRINDTDFLVGCMDSDDPVIKLLRSDGSSLEVIDSIILSGTSTPTSYSGIVDVAVWEGKWTATYIGNYIEGDQERSRSYIAYGALDFSPGTASRENLRLIATRAVSNGTGSPYTEVEFLNEWDTVVLWRESSVNAGYFVASYKFSDAGFISQTSATKVVEYSATSGTPSIAAGPGDTFVVLWAEADTSECE